MEAGEVWKEIEIIDRRDVACYVLLAAFEVMDRETLQATSLRGGSLLNLDHAGWGCGF